MINRIRFRSSKYLIRSLNLNPTTNNLIMCHLNSTRNSTGAAKKDLEYRSKFLSKSFNSTKRIRKSLVSIQIKKQEIEQSQFSLCRRKIQRLRVINCLTKVEIRFRKAAASIQRVFRGYLVRRQYRSILLKFAKDRLALGIQNLDSKITDIWKNTGVMKDSAVRIQRAIRNFLQLKLENNEKRRVALRETNAAIKIQTWMKLKWFQKQAEISKKLEKIRENLRFLRLKQLWNQRKFNWNAIQKHYGLIIEDNCSTGSIVEKIVIITHKLPTALAKGKFIRKPKKPQKTKKKLKPKVIKSCLATSNSACSKNAESEKFAYSLAIPSSTYKDDKTDSVLNTLENLIDLERYTPIDKIKNLFKEINLDEEAGNELIESFSRY